jgi:hexosaminidase
MKLRIILNQIIKHFIKDKQYPAESCTFVSNKVTTILLECMMKISKSNMRNKIGFFILLLLLLFGCYTFQKKKEISKYLPVIPLPATVKELPGSCRLTDPVIIYYSDQALRFSAEYLKEWLDTLFNKSTKIVLANDTSTIRAAITLTLDDQVKQDEGYLLEVGEKVELTGKRSAGVFYGVQTLLQLIYAYRNPSGEVVLPAMKITDYPRFAWRGMHLDVSRHFFAKEFVKRYLDILVLHKMNTFHWHLVDDQGWRIKIKKYPRLTEFGAWRADREEMPWDFRTPQQPGEKASYGGFYTQDDIREIVDYASERFITIVPEIEMPAHCSSALAAYPQFSCSGEAITVPTGGLWPLVNLYCAGNDSSFIFLQDVLQEVMELFPSKYIHIGGDEADKSAWRQCPKCQTRMREEELKDEDELQSYFIRRIEKYLNQNNRILIGWDEILEGGLAENATVMSWRGIEGGVMAAKMKHQVIMTPTSHCYFDYYQSRDLEIEPLAIGGFTDLLKVYSYEPVPEELNKKESRFILGAQGNVWSEYISSGSHAEYMALPRMTALSEVVWTQTDLKDERSFLVRLKSFLNFLSCQGINYHVATPLGLKPKMVFIDSLKIELSNPYPFGEIRYTLNGNDPQLDRAPVYSDPFTIYETNEIRAARFLDSGKRSLIKSALVLKQQPLPASQVSQVLETGLRYEYFEGEITSLKDFNLLTAKNSGTIIRLTLPPEVTDDHFGLTLEGFINIPATGVYSFTLISDDGSQLLIDDELVADNDGLHELETVAGQIALEKGYHHLRILYFESTGEEVLEVKIEGPGISERIVPAKMLFRDRKDV